MENLLEIKNLHVGIKKKKEYVPIIEDISFSIKKGETIGIVGESGCGKTMTSLAIMKLLPQNIQINDGDIIFDGENLRGITEKDMRKKCGKDIGMIFQEPMTSLNPLFTVEEQISESLRYHLKYNKEQCRKKVIELLQLVGISEPEKRMKQYPHEFSGGMRQRVMIAIAIACNPKLIIADEPTTALDVTVQAQILSLIRELKSTYGNSLMLITHNWGVVAELADKVMVMYAGEILEMGSVLEIFDAPKHPYTEALLSSVERLNLGNGELEVVPGTVPRPGEMIDGCKFSNRCSYAKEICRVTHPDMRQLNDEHCVRCWKGTEKYAESQ